MDVTCWDGAIGGMAMHFRASALLSEAWNQLRAHRETAVTPHVGGDLVTACRPQFFLFFYYLNSIIRIIISHETNPV